MIPMCGNYVMNPMTMPSDPTDMAIIMAENALHRRANLLRAIFDGYGPLDEFINEAISHQDFDRVPWMVAAKTADGLCQLRVVVGDVVDAWLNFRADNNLDGTNGLDELSTRMMVLAEMAGGEDRHES